MANKVGAPRDTFPTFVAYLDSYAFQGQGPSIVWDANNRTYEEPNADKRESAMGFDTLSTVSHNMTEGQGHFVLGQAMDLT